jgi:hypothetical protein
MATFNVPSNPFRPGLPAPITYTEYGPNSGGSPEVTLLTDATTARRTLQCAWGPTQTNPAGPPTWSTFAKYAIGFPLVRQSSVSGAKFIARINPWLFPGLLNSFNKPYLYVQGMQKLEGIGPCGNDQGQNSPSGDPAIVYQMARITFGLTTLPYDVAEDGAVLNQAGPLISYPSDAYVVGNGGAPSSVAVSGVTNFTTDPTITTTSPHGLVVGQAVTIAGVVEQIIVFGVPVEVPGHSNGLAAVVSVPTPTTFTVSLGAYTRTYVSGGTVVPFDWPTVVGRNITRWPKPASRLLVIPNGALAFAPDEKLILGAGFPILKPSSLVQYTWYDVPRAGVPFGAQQQLLGCVNAATFDGFPPQTLRLDAVDPKPTISATGDRTFTVTYQMRFEPNFDMQADPPMARGHNWTVRNQTPGGGLNYYRVSSDGTPAGVPPYRVGAFSSLFRPDQN